MEKLFDDLDDPADALVAALWLTPGWPQDAARDRAFMVELLRSYTPDQLEASLDRFRMYLIDRGGPSRTKWTKDRFRDLRAWFSGRYPYRAGGISSGGPNQRPRGSITRPRTAAEHDADARGQSGPTRW